MASIPKFPTITNVSVDVINAIRNSASQNYQNYVPVATPDAESIRAIGQILMDYPHLQNEFVPQLIGKVGKSIITSKMYKNPFSRFKKGVLEMGETIEEIFVNICKVHEYDAEDASQTAFKRELPDVRSAFHVLNYRKQYPTTVQQEDLRSAFLSWGAMDSFVAKTIEAMYTASEYDELQVMKYMIARQALQGLLKVHTIPAVTKENLNDIVSNMREVSNNLEFLSPDYNLAGVMNNSLKSDQTIIVSTAFDAKMSVDVLAVAFNMDKADLLAGQRVLIDGFGKLDDARLDMLFKDDTNYVKITPEEKVVLNALPAMVIDNDWWQVYDRMITVTEQYIAKGMYWNYYLNTWKIFSVSPFACNCLFVAGAPSVTSITLNPVAVTVSKGQSAYFNPLVKAENFGSQAVVWSINSTKSTITQQGKLTVGAEETATTITVTATSVQDGTKKGTATVTVSA